LTWSIACHVTFEEFDGDDDEPPSVKATCSKCGHETESYGTDPPSIRRCLALVREECPAGERNFYVEADQKYEEPEAEVWLAMVAGWQGQGIFRPAAVLQADRARRGTTRPVREAGLTRSPTSPRRIECPVTVVGMEAMPVGG
jgi:hypothetical protein